MIKYLKKDTCIDFNEKYDEKTAGGWRDRRRWENRAAAADDSGGARKSGGRVGVTRIARRKSRLWMKQANIEERRTDRGRKRGEKEV